MLDTRTSERHLLSTGTLDLTIADQGMDGLFRIAERQNPKRAFLFVSTVLGRHIPVTPSVHRKALEGLAKNTIPHLLDGPVFVMGFAETAVGIGAGVFDCLRQELMSRRMSYLPTTRHPVPGKDIWFSIEEGHSHATQHFIMRPSRNILCDGPDSTLILVDDETTTGDTFTALAQGVFEKGRGFGRIILVTLTDWSAGKAAGVVARATGCPDVRSVSLLQGGWDWTQDVSKELPSLPAGGVAGCPEWYPDAAAPLCSPRMGIRDREMSNGMYIGYKIKLPRMSRLDRVLVIGTGEHVWMPFLYAEAVEGDGMNVKFIATTRSPIMDGPVIEHKMTFPDHYGLGLDMYLHNVDPDDFDQIVLFSETGITGVHSDLRRALGKGVIVDDQYNIFNMMDF